MDPIAIALILLALVGLLIVLIGLLMPGAPPRNGVYCDDPKIVERDPVAQLRRNGGA